MIKKQIHIVNNTSRWIMLESILGFSLKNFQNLVKNKETQVMGFFVCSLD